VKARCVRVSDVEELRVKELCVKDQELYVTRVLDAKELCQNGSCQHHGTRLWAKAAKACFGTMSKCHRTDHADRHGNGPSATSATSATQK
jgi:hypothetical protein